MTFNGPQYCQVTDVITAMTSYNAAGTPAEISSSVVTLAIQQASAKVSGWTSSQWGIDAGGSVVPVPDLIVSLTINIAAYYATLSYRKNKPLEANDPILIRYQDAMTDLESLQTGQISANPLMPNKGASQPGSVRNVRPRIFSPSDSNTTIRRGRVQPDTYPGAGTLSQPWGEC